MKKYISYSLSLLLIMSVIVTNTITRKYAFDEGLKKGLITQKISKADKTLDSLIREAINNGNKQAFNEALLSRVLIEGDTKMFYYSLLMANKHHDWRACEYVYSFLSYEKNKGFTSNNIEYYSDDKSTRKLTTFYLLKSYEYGNPDTLKVELKELFPKNQKIPSSEEFLMK